MGQLQQFLTKEKTCPAIITYLNSGLDTFRKRPHAPQTASSPWQQDIPQIGWTNMLTGFISTKLMKHQMAYYGSIGSRKKGVTWASKLIIQWWGLLHKLWLGRNDVLHKKEIIHQLSGQCLLDIEIFDIGYEGLPVVHKWFQQSKEELLAKSIEYKKGWLLLVKMVKESMNILQSTVYLPGLGPSVDG